VSSAVTAVLASAFSLSACVFYQSYPSSWVARGEGCSDISGVYSDAGERSARGLPFPFSGTVIVTRSLSGLLSGRGEYGKPFNVELTQQEGDKLRVRLWVDDTVGSQYRVGYRCTPSGIELRLPARWMTQGLGVVRASGSLYLATGANGDLIGNLKYRTFGVALIVPIIASGNAWYRFTRAEVPPPRQPLQ